MRKLTINRKKTFVAGASKVFIYSIEIVLIIYNIVDLS